MTENSAKLISALKEFDITLFTAESCTGGLIAKKLTDVPGASEVLMGGVVSYTNRIKKDLLFVKEDTLEKHTAVSSEVAMEMAVGAKRYADIGVSVTGYASGDKNEIPVGLVYIGVAFGERAMAYENHFEGNREEVRDQAADKAIEILLNLLGR